MFSIMKHNKLFTAPKWLLLLSISKEEVEHPLWCCWGIQMFLCTKELVNLNQHRIIEWFEFLEILGILEII